MRSKLISALTVIGAVTILLLASNTVALAATGKGFLLGKTNTTSKATTLKRTAPGAALKITTKKTTDAPFKVNGTGKVANLNADKIDGLDSSAFAPAAGTTAQLPVAAGFVDSTGTLGNHRGTTSVAWNAASSRYDLTLTGQNYYYQDYSVSVTPICSNATVRSSSVSNNLIIQIFTATTGAAIQCSFSYTVYKLPA